MEGPPSVAGRTNATAVMFAPHAPHPTYVFPQGKHPENTHQSLFNRAPSPSNFYLTLQLQPQDTHLKTPTPIRVSNPRLTQRGKDGLRSGSRHGSAVELTGPRLSEQDGRPRQVPESSTFSMHVLPEGPLRLGKSVV